MATKPQGSGAIDVRCPVNWAHPLNYGLLDEWAVLPASGWNGSKVLRDLVRPAKVPRDGTLSTTSTTIPSWGNATHKGGVGSILFDGSTNYVDCGASIPGLQFLSTTPFSVAFWIYPLSTTANQAVFSYTNAPASGWFTRYNRTSSTGVMEFWIYNQAGLFTGTSTSTAYPANTWTHCVITFDGSNDAGGFKFYANGVNVTGTSSFNTPPGSPSYNSTFRVNIGRRNSNDEFFNCKINDVAAWNRKLAVNEVVSLYEESTLSNPNRWNWVRPVKYFGVTAAAAVFAGEEDSFSYVTKYVW